MFILGAFLTIALVVLYIAAAEKLANWLNKKDIMNYAPAFVLLVDGGLLLGIAILVQVLYSIGVIKFS